MNALGIQILLDLKQCDRNVLDDMPYIREALVTVAEETGATIVGQSFHKFDPVGVTGILAIAESHISIHTWPEYGYAAVDIFTCSDNFKARQAAEFLIQRFGCKEPSIVEIRRGELAELAVPTG